MSARGGWISSFSGLPRPVPSSGQRVTRRPRTRAAPSRARAVRTISTYSRVRETGRANDTPCQPSDTCGPDTPRPRRKRPSESVSSVAAVIAVIAGVRAGIWNSPEPRPIRSVTALRWPSTVAASWPHASETHTESRPSRSACLASSICSSGEYQGQ